MLYAILCYAHEETVFAWSKEEEEAVMAKLIEVQTPYAKAGKLGPVGRLMPTTAATTVRKGKDEPLVLDGPFAETKEVLLGFYTVDVEALEEAVAFSKELSAVNPGSSSYEIRPFYVFHPGEIKNGETHNRETGT
ncbi:YciI family protein [Rhizobium terrae]|uniref:YciI family protein n=1 Tax=Rhizobium terrae TaxID=2171756 RepID=UPI000E3CFD5D|nr:YciI family protein [Rhizobium terrae]